MQALRRLRALAGFLLAWFALSVGVATAAPFVQPHSLQLICSTGGDVHLIVLADDGAQEQRGPALDCPLCLHLGTAPPPAPPGVPAPPQPLAHALQPVAAAHIAARTAAPLPARGPPVFS